MTDQVNGYPATPTPNDPGQGQNVQPDAGQGQGAADTPLTRAEIMQLLSNQTETIKGEMQRFRQSTTDRVENRVRQQIEQQTQALRTNVAALRQMNVNIPDDMVRQTEAAIVQEALRGSVQAGDDYDQDPAQGQAQPPDLEVSARVAEANAQAIRYSAQLGIRLERGDAEYINPATYATPEEWATAYKAALDRKAARLGVTRPQQLQPQQPSNPAARLTGLGGGSPAADALGSSTRRLQELQGKAGKTSAEWKEMQDLAASIRAQLPRTPKR